VLFKPSAKTELCCLFKATEDTMRHLPGLRATNLHVSRDLKISP